MNAVRGLLEKTSRIHTFNQRPFIGISLFLGAFAQLCMEGAPAQEMGSIDSVLRAAVEEGKVPGVAAIAANSKGVFYEGAFGIQEVGSSRLSVSTIFQIASMTKPVTSVAVMQLIEEGALRLDDPVSKHLSHFAALQVLEGFDEESGRPQLRAPSQPVTVRQLLTHTSGFGYTLWDPLLREAAAKGLSKSSDANTDGGVNLPLVFDPGEKWYYGVSTDWLGRLVERIRNQSLEDVFDERIFTPLKMDDSFFNVPEGFAGRRIPHFARQSDGTLREVPLGPIRHTSDLSGGGGLSSTPADYIRFVRALLRGGELDGARILKAETVNLMWRNHIGDLEAGAMKNSIKSLSNDFDLFPGSIDRFGLGFLINTEPVEGGRASGSLMWAGLYNTYFWIDPTRDICAVLMTQILPFNDAGATSLLDDFEQAVYKIQR